MIRLAAGVPAFGMQIDAAQAEMWLLLGHALAANDDQFQFVGIRALSMNPVADARNAIVDFGLQLEADWVLMVDADTYYHGEEDAGGIDILRMIKTGNDAGAAVIGAPVRARGWKDHPHTIWMVDDVPRILSLNQRSTEATMSLAAPEKFIGKVTPCARMGAAFLAINLNWIQREMPDPPWFAFSPSMIGPREGRMRAHGEDVNFCDAVNARHGLILVDGRMQPKHVLAGERI